MKTVCVYALECPILRAVFYVGLSNKPKIRFRQHLCQPHSRKMREWFKELKALGREPVLFILERVESSKGRAAERKWVEHYSRVSPFLLNIRMAHGDDSNVTRQRRHKAV